MGSRPAGSLADGCSVGVLGCFGEALVQVVGDDRVEQIVVGACWYQPAFGLEQFDGLRWPGAGCLPPGEGGMQ